MRFWSVSEPQTAAFQSRFRAAASRVLPPCDAVRDAQLAGLGGAHAAGAAPVVSARFVHHIPTRSTDLLGVNTTQILQV